MLFLQKLATFYNVNYVIFCPVDHDDSLEELSASFKGTPMYYYMSFGSGPDFFNQSERAVSVLNNRRHLIFCPALDMTFFYNQANGNFLSSEFVWVTARSRMNATEHVPLRLDSNMVTYQCINDTTIELSEHYKIKGNEIITISLGQWTHEDDLIFQTDIRWWERRSNLYGTILVDVTLPYSPWNIETYDQEGLKLSGVFPDLMDVLQESLNFTRVATYPEDGEWGLQKVVNESKLIWSGIVGDLIGQRGDIRYCTWIRSAFNVDHFHFLKFKIPYTCLIVVQYYHGSTIV